MSRHEGVSCDSCLKSNFKGLRYKCLICYDYDVCADCYERGRVSSNHAVDHPMQCMATRVDMELFYGGETINADVPQSYTCPICKQMGFSQADLVDHVRSNHQDNSMEVICPICCSQPRGDANLVTDDFAGHLTIEHRTETRELISLLDEPPLLRPNGGVRRLAVLPIGTQNPIGNPRPLCRLHPTETPNQLSGPYPLTSPYPLISPAPLSSSSQRRTTSLMHYTGSGSISMFPPSHRVSRDPIADLLSQLSEARRGIRQRSQMHELHHQIQLERHERSMRQRMDRWVPRRPPMATYSSSHSAIAEDARVSGRSERCLSGTTINGAADNGGSRSLNSRLSSREWNISTLLSDRKSESSVTTNASEVTLMSTSLLNDESNNSNANDNESIGRGVDKIGSDTNTRSVEIEVQPQFLLSQLLPPTLSDEDRAQLEQDRADRSEFTQSLLMSALALSTLSSNEINSNITDESSQTAVNTGDNWVDGERMQQNQQPQTLSKNVVDEQLQPSQQQQQ